MTVKTLLAVFLAAILTENYVLAKFLGICPFLGVSKKLDSAVGMSVAVIVVMVLATAVTYPIYTYLLIPFGLEYLQTILFILIIAGLVQLVEIVLKKYIPSLYQSLGEGGFDRDVRLHLSARADKRAGSGNRLPGRYGDVRRRPLKA